MSNRTCPECGAQVAGNGNRKYCADICNWRAKERRRVEAGYYQQPHVAQRVREAKRVKYLGEVAAGKRAGTRLAIWRERGADGLHDHPSECVVAGCGQPTYARLKCKPHYQREMLSEGSVWAIAALSTGCDYERRARAYGVPFEDFNKIDVFIRDGWVCGICSESVDASLAYPDPMSASLDHIVPLSRGGGHLESNTQCSHLSCNVRKGARDAESAETRAVAGAVGVS